jgi:RNA polymerase sigma factor (sigma-70 family)
MPGSLAASTHAGAPFPESTLTPPDELIRLLAAAPGPEQEAAWTSFLVAYSPLLLKVATAFAPGYDGALDRYAYMLDELRRGECRRLRAYCADGRGRFSTWLAVVARRLCLDHYRLRYGRDRGGLRADRRPTHSRAVRRGLIDLAGGQDELACVADATLPDPVEQMDARARSASLCDAIASLEPSDQLLLRLRFEQGLAAREIAPLLGLPSQFHVYRRIEAVCAILRSRLALLPPRRWSEGDSQTCASGRSGTSPATRVGAISSVVARSSGSGGATGRAIRRSAPVQDIDPDRHVTRTRPLPSDPPPSPGECPCRAPSHSP